MVRFHGKTKTLTALFAAISITAQAELVTMKLTDAPLSQVIELYSRATGKSVFVDETTQKQRRVTLFLRDMTMEQAFNIIKRTTGLISEEVGSGAIYLYPPEKARIIPNELKPSVLNTPKGVDTKWTANLLNGAVPGLKTTPAPGDQRALFLYGTENQTDKAFELSKKLPAIGIKRDFLTMNEAMAKLAAKEIQDEDVEVDALAGGLSWRGKNWAISAFREKLMVWIDDINWAGEVFTPKELESAKALKAAQAVKGKALVSDLGGTGSIYVEGPLLDRKKIFGVLTELDKQEKRRHCEAELGESKPEIAKEVAKAVGAGVESMGDRRIALYGKPGVVAEAASVLKTLGKKRKQVQIRFRLVEIARSRTKALGIDLDKIAYSYGEIKEFHANDVLPLILRLVHEGKDARILAEPNLRIIEGEEGKITIGDRIPLEIATTAQTESGSLVKLQAQLSWVDVGIKMSVKNVSVNNDGSIRMGVRGEVSSVFALTKQGYPQIRTREAESSLRVNNGDSIIMSGLLNHEERRGRNKIPFIGNLPFIGGLGRSQDSNFVDSEIVMIVTAKVAQD